MTTRSRTKHRFLRTMCVATAAAGALTLAAGTPAFAAAPADTALTINRLSNGTYDVIIGIDFHISEQDARAIIDAPGDPYTAKVVGKDPVSDDDLFTVPLVTVGASAGFGLSADFVTNVAPFQLNEDDDFFDRVDDVLGRITFTDPRSGQRIVFDTREIHRRF